jgi:hypothetical protein
VQPMVFRIGAKRVDEDVDVRQDQSRPSMRSKRLALSFRSTPGEIPPPARHTGSDTGRGLGRLSGRRSTSSRPCSIRDVRVVLRRTASCRARSSKASSKRTVVLMRHSVRMICLYVKRWLP